ncbi:MAG: substrate-binding domain-containing protein [Candidatus Desulforudis sp.]|nr:substrate-binding domain-containing protein [Desulforudis sp.]
MLRKIVVFFLLLPLALGLSGCGLLNRGGAARPAEPLTIAYSVADENRDGNQVIKRIVQSRAEADEQVRVTWRDAGGDARRQEQDVERFIEQEVDAVVIQFVEPQMGPGIVRRLAMNRIKVVALETLAPNAPLDAYIASEQVRSGELQARYVAHNLPPGAPGRVLVLAGDPNDPVSRNIVQGIVDFMDGQPGFTLDVREHPMADPRRAAATVEEALAAARPGAVLAVDSRMAVSAAEVLRRAGVTDEILTVGVGAERTAAESLVAGEHDAEVDVRPDLLAQFSYDAALGLARGGHWTYDTQMESGDFTVPARLIPVRLVQGNNAFLLEEYYEDLTRGGAQQGEQSSDQQGGGEQGQQQGGGQEQQQQPTTKLKITTRDGKTMELDVPGEIQSIEAQQQEGGGQAGGQQGGQQGGQEGGGQDANQTGGQ